MASPPFNTAQLLKLASSIFGAFVSAITFGTLPSCVVLGGKRACSDNCLQTINPSLAKEWHPSKNGTLAYITKLASDEVLEMHKINLKKFGIQVKYNKLKRNKAGEITSIKITIKNEKGAQSSATWKVDDGIPSIEFGETEGSLIARTSDMN